MPPRKKKEPRSELDIDVEKYLKSNRIFSKTNKYKNELSFENLLKYLEKIETYEHIKYVIIQDKIYDKTDNIRFLYCDDTFLIIINNDEVFENVRDYNFYNFSKKIFSYDGSITKLNF